jgi:hypothetical protein
MRSEKLPHFTKFDPPPKNYTPAKMMASAEIEALMAEFLARGGQIQRLDATANRVPVFIVNDVVRS